MVAEEGVLHDVAERLHKQLDAKQHEVEELTTTMGMLQQRAALCLPHS